MKFHGHFNHNRMTLVDLVRYTELLESKVSQLIEVIQQCQTTESANSACENILFDMKSQLKNIKSCESTIEGVRPFTYDDIPF